MFKKYKSPALRALSVLLAVITLFSTLQFSVSAFAKSKVNTYPAPSHITASSFSEETAKIKWKLKGGLKKNSGYQVLVYNKKKGKYISKGHTTKAEFILRKLPDTEIRKVKIRTYVKKNGKKHYGEAALFKIPMPLKKTKISEIKYVSKGKMKVSWKAVDGADGYIFQYATLNSFKPANTCTLIFDASETMKKISGLSDKMYYVRIAPFKTVDGINYASKYCAQQSVNIEKGSSFKTMVNVNETDNSGRKAILKLTKKGVDIKKYETTYDKLEAIYVWHRAHAQSFASCYYFTINFCKCVDALFGETKKYDSFIYMADGHFQNRSGGRPVHKWPVIYLQGVPFIMDGRIEGYINEDCFGLEKGKSARAKRFLQKSWHTSYRNEDIFKSGFAVKYKVIKD